AFSEGSGSQSVFAGSSPITVTSPSSKAHQKSGSFPPPALPQLQRSYDPVRLPPVPPPVATLRPLPSHRTGLPRLLGSPFRRAVPTTPADRAGAHVDCFPAHTAFPKWQEGRHPHCHFRGLPRLHSRSGPPDRSAAQSNLCHEAPALRLPARAARQLPDQSTTLRVESSSTDDSRLRGALPMADMARFSRSLRRRERVTSVRLKRWL